jgi:acetylornithine deacetylase/succinyl-diaminopimelate desuccinylase family protein
MTRTENLLRELIALPSVNPALMPPGDPRAGEQRVGEFLANVAARAKLDIEFRTVFSNRANLLARLTPNGKLRQRILLAPHMDTVGDAAMAESLFQPLQKNGRLYGRGACDTKGSIAAMLVALSEIAESGPRPQQTEIVFAALVDEEIGQNGSRALVKEGFRADLAIVGEPTRLRVVTAHKGDVWLQLATRGKAAHGARPELGKNAVHEMARIVDLLETRYARQLRRHRHPLLGSRTINVGSIQGGTQPNIVPDRCAITIDRRTLPGETEASVVKELRLLLKQHHFTARISNFKTAPCFALETNPKLPLIAQFLRVVKQSSLAAVHFFSDAGVLAQGGIPSVLFGPGDIAQAHTPDEWISLAQLERGKNLLRQFFETLP